MRYFCGNSKQNLFPPFLASDFPSCHHGCYEVEPLEKVDQWWMLKRHWFIFLQPGVTETPSRLAMRRAMTSMRGGAGAPGDSATASQRSMAITATWTPGTTTVGSPHGKQMRTHEPQRRSYASTKGPGSVTTARGRTPHSVSVTSRAPPQVIVALVEGIG